MELASAAARWFFSPWRSFCPRTCLFDGDAMAYRMLETKYLDADGVQDVYYECQQAVEAIWEQSQGKKVKPLLVDPGFVIHQGNLSEKAAQMWGSVVARQEMK